MTTVIQKSKVLLTCHLMMHEYQFGHKFSTVFLRQKFPFKNDESSKSDFLPGYYQYLQKIGSNLQILHLSKVQQYPIPGGNQHFLGVQSKLLWLFKISNIVSPPI